jgi:predicted nucleic acid-binding protein
MILVDTSIWVDHLRRGNSALAHLLEVGEAVTHPFVVGELACGSLRNRLEILDLLHALPQVREAGHTEVLILIEKKKLFGQGIGWIDAHLLASALLSDARIWTSDRRLSRAAAILGIRWKGVCKRNREAPRFSKISPRRPLKARRRTSSTDEGKATRSVAPRE